MLHEILLSLSGLSSPIWDQIHTAKGTGEAPLKQYVSEPEKAMLETLHHLHKLYVNINDSVSRVSSSYDSPVCRAVSSSIAQDQLARYRKHILMVEVSILQKDARYVGAYETVPLSSIVAEFAPWARRLEWLSYVTDNLTCRGDDHRSSSSKSPSAALLDLLEQETRTGYTDIENMATSLLSVGQQAWMRSASLWLLYGRLPVSDASDFCVRVRSESLSPMNKFMVDEARAPKFLTLVSRQSMLDIGAALNHLDAQNKKDSATTKSSREHTFSLLPKHIEILGSLQYPLGPALLEEALQTVNQSVSENALSQLLPLPLIMQFLGAMSDYMLLGHGEFAVALISNADERLIHRQREARSTRPLRKIGNLDDVAVKDAEMKGILSKTFAELASRRGHEEAEDEAFMLAQSLLTLGSLQEDTKQAATRTIATLLPTPAGLLLNVPSKSALHMFLSTEDAKIYSIMNAYLLSIHRASLHLAGLWKLPSQRRSHPSSSSPSSSAARGSRGILSARRQRETVRLQRTRKHWTRANETLFLMNELSSYLQGEVLHQSWTHFRKWLHSNATSSSTRTSRPGTSSSVGQAGIDPSTSARNSPNDPRAVAAAHRAYLRALKKALFLDHTAVTSHLRDLLIQVDHFVALFVRLQNVWQGLDLQEDDGVLDAFSNYAQDERDVLAEMDRTAEAIHVKVADVVAEVRKVENELRHDTGDTMLPDVLNDLSDHATSDSSFSRSAIVLH